MQKTSNRAVSNDDLWEIVKQYFLDRNISISMTKSNVKVISATKLDNFSHAQLEKTLGTRIRINTDRGNPLIASTLMRMANALGAWNDQECWYYTAVLFHNMDGVTLLIDGNSRKVLEWYQDFGNNG